MVQSCAVIILPSSMSTVSACMIYTYNCYMPEQRKRGKESGKGDKYKTNKTNNPPPNLTSCPQIPEDQPHPAHFSLH
ncbi:hypothetical protein QBC46DRAFT_162370 [Diplogelasinospora grovesii]|uniref:Secreted protein n=1 Tax=Diplogelasinospora grovesii TaxID=303347 RepID=A0AAN6S2B3_9PEZI|nr:hypothetical protein QBC46DRAFT_162370 [Diplogelasinospora grovesii]